MGQAISTKDKAKAIKELAPLWKEDAQLRFAVECAEQGEAGAGAGAVIDAAYSAILYALSIGVRVDPPRYM